MNTTRRLIVVVVGLLLAVTRSTAAITPAARRRLDDGVGVCGEEPDPSNPPPCMDSDSWKQCTDIRDYSGCVHMLVTQNEAAEASCVRKFACLEWDTCSSQGTDDADAACQSIVDGGCYAVVVTTGVDGTRTFACGDPDELNVQPAPADGLDPSTGGGLGDGNGSDNGNGVRPSMTEDQCQKSGGVAFYDPGSGNTRKAGYLCDDTKRPPMADISGTNGWKGAVCCPVDNDNYAEEDDPDQVNEAAEEEPVDPQQPSDTPEDVEDDPPTTDTEDLELAPLSSMTEDECKNSGGVAFYDPGDGSTRIQGYVCDDTKLRPIGGVSGTGADEGAICCPVPGATTNDFIDDTTVTTTLCSDGDCDDQGVIERVGERPQLTRDECASSGGEAVTDPGDASTRREDYVCTNGSGQPPVGNIRYDVGDSIPREGEVCCPLPTEIGDVVPSMADDDECGAAGGWVYVDAAIDTTTIDRSNFLCPPSGMPGESGHPPIGTVQSREGAVCCPLNVSGGERKSIPREECLGTGGEVVFPDSADGGLCPATGEPPVADIEGSATGEVCCIAEDEGSLPADRPNVGSREDCADMGGEYYVDPGDGRSGRRDFVCPGSGLAPMGDIQSGAMEGEVCCPVSEGEVVPADRPSIDTREACTAMGGDYYVDPGDGSTLLQSFVCPNGETPIGDIQQTGGMEGEVCCPIVGEAVVDPALPDTAEVERPMLTRSECEATAGGGMYHVYGDPGDGSTRRPGFVCPDTAGEGPIANIRYEADEPIATEGEVCCPLPITMGPDEQQTMVTLVECDEAGGRVVALGVDATSGAGNGSDVSDLLLCPDGETPLGVIRYEVGEQITTEGEICCVADDRDGASGALSDSPAAVARVVSSPLALMVGALFIAAPHLA